MSVPAAWRGTAAAVLAIVATGIVAAVGGCARGGSESASAPPARVPVDTSGESVYDLVLPLTDAGGGSLMLSDLADTVRVAAMMYTNCSSVCPRITEDMKGIEAQLGGEDLSGVGFVLFSLDPGRDSPDALSTFADDFGLDRRRWRLFSASEDGVRDLAAVLGVKYKEEAAGEFAHSAMIFVIDRNGVVRHRQEGLNATPDALLAAVRAAR